MHSIVLTIYCTVLYCTVLYCTVLYAVYDITVCIDLLEYILCRLGHPLKKRILLYILNTKLII